MPGRDYRGEFENSLEGHLFALAANQRGLFARR
jgi:hypothetical protein